ncbi:hypothetical protein [Bradyrhizobium brasilense]|uniref:Uncharacterized protein n=1 Tax=Bradyrhizobium brasilense TaxID=1419277 RepID=A0ABY8JKC8_9BRAD|nr:hypothetical protein [Bradyrhizobium brasilense]WFU64846.1 hypothetical protein QA636_04660 [Bradyrhizobium brasilense]
MTLAEVFALGIEGYRLCDRLAYHLLAFDPPITRAQVRAEYNAIDPYSTEKRRALVREQVRKRLASQTKRNCMCCRKPFPSEGHHNRLCDACRKRGYQMW